MKNGHDWQPPRKTAVEKLTDTRHALHFAAQAAANLGRLYGKDPGDYSHISLRWLPAEAALASELVEAEGGRLRAALRFDPLEWVLLDGEGAPLKTLPLAGRSLGVLETDIRAVLAAHGLDAAKYTLKPPFETEDHPLKHGTEFQPERDAEARRELAAYYDGAERMLQSLRMEYDLSALPRCWPHHFDYALLITLGGSGEQARTIGLGMSPGDHYYDQPYFYATPWPYPPRGTTLKPLTAPALWHTHEWTGAVLRSADLPAAGAGTRVADYWREARSILEPLLRV